MKKEAGSFDVLMGTHDGAEMGELICILCVVFTRNKLQFKKYWVLQR